MTHKPESNLPNGNNKVDTNYNRKKTVGIFTLGLILVAIIWSCLWLFYFRYYEFTDDAYVNGNMIQLNTSVSGNVVAFYADNTDIVEKGQLLVSLDDSKYRLIYETELAELGKVVLEVRKFYDNVHLAETGIKIKKTKVSKLRYDHQNRQSLIDSQAISNQDLVHSQDDLSIAAYELQQGLDELQVAKDAAGNTSFFDHPKIEQQKGKVRQAFYALKHCQIYAPATGYVAKRSVNVGQWVEPQTTMMVIIPAHSVWVDANFKETQLKFMRVGQQISVSFDLYGSSVLHTGKVLGIASGSGSVFSLIPPQNATGNWIKIVQRVTVRVSLDPELVKKYPLRLGISAKVYVDLTNQELPFLNEKIIIHPVETTDVYHLDLREVDTIIDQVIKNNMKI